MRALTDRGVWEGGAREGAEKRTAGAVLFPLTVAIGMRLRAQISQS